MKHVFAILVPLCIFCYFGYAVTYAVLGKRNVSSTTIVDTAGSAIEGVEISSDGNSFVTEYSIEDSFSDIEIDTGACNVVVKAVDTDVTNVSVIMPESFEDKGFSVEVNGGTLEIETKASGHYNIGSIIENIAKGFEDGDWSNAFSIPTAVVEIPAGIYEELEVNVGSGSVTLKDVCARIEYFDVGSGALTFEGKSDFTADEVSFFMGSGKAEAVNLLTKEYDIQVGSGKFDIDGLCGEGEFSMGAGSGTLGYSQYNGSAEFTIGSGSLKIVVPNDADAQISADLGSGSVSVNAAGKNAVIKKSGTTVLGNGGNVMDINVGAGKVSISSKDYSQSSTAVTVVTSTYAAVEDIAQVEAVEDLSSGTAV